MSKGPCHNCTFRTLGCHASCYLYAIFKEKLAAEKAAYNKTRAKEVDYYLYKKSLY